MSEVVIKIENLSKSYLIGASRGESYTALRDILSNKAKEIIKNIKTGQIFNPQREQNQEFWALKDINLEIRRGEVVGIIGRNGAGKSTLLKILSRITEPTKGRVKIKGRVASLLEVGTGFHPELTGRENIFLSGAVLGMKRWEIKKRFDEIVAFAGIEEFLETPVKRYSSGMYVRLGFAIAAHLEPEILLVDEVLAVGDAEFQKKCLGKLDDVAKGGRTVLFVSHNMGVIRQLCDKGFLIDKGQIYSKGDISILIRNYTELNKAKSINIVFDGPLKTKVKLLNVKLNNFDLLSTDAYISPFNDLEFKIELEIGTLRPFRVTLSVFKDNCRIFSLHDEKALASPPGKIISIYKIPSKILRPGLYSLAIGGLERNTYGEWFWRKEVCTFWINEEWNDEIESINHGLINLSASTKRIIL